MESNNKLNVKVGDKIRIIKMDNQNGKDKSADNYNGRIGIVEHIDSLGQLHTTAGSLAVIPEIDKFEILNQES